MKRRLLIVDKSSYSEIDLLAHAIGIEILTLIATYNGTPGRKHPRLSPLSLNLAKRGKGIRNLSKFNPRIPGDRRTP